MRRALIAATLTLPLLAARADPLAGRTAGPPQDCVTLTQGNGPTIIDDHTILYSGGGGRRVWATHPIGTCTAMQPFDTLIVDVYGGQVCRNDRFRVLTQGMSIPSGYCRFGAFTPYTKAAR